MSSTRWRRLTFQHREGVLAQQVEPGRDAAGALDAATLPFRVRQHDRHPVAVLALAVLLNKVGAQAQALDVLAADEWGERHEEPTKQGNKADEN